MTLEQALQTSPAPPEILATQALIDLEYLDFDGQIQTGFLVAHRDLEAEIRAIFAEIFAAHFPVFGMRPTHEFAWSDDESMAKNNTSAFNYRPKLGKSSLSHHATGRAIDINPVQNPYVNSELILPPGAEYRPEIRGTLNPNGPVVAAFEKRGWEWGGRWTRLSDWHHFQKPAPSPVSP